MSPLALFDDLVDREQGRVQVGDGEERASAVARVALGDLQTRVAREDLPAQATERVHDRLVELSERLVTVRLRLGARLFGSLDPKEHVADELDRGGREMEHERLLGI